jgi:hypothetical protein
VVLVSHQLNQIRRLCERVAWIDGGSVRQSGATHEVVSAYESAMSRGERDGHQPERGPATKARFVRWEIAGSRPENLHLLKALGSATVKFIVDIRERVRTGHYGVALRNHDLQVVWAWETRNLKLDVGERQFCHTFPTLPVRPGLYTWLVALYDEGDLVDVWDCVPEMMVATENFQHPDDQWSGTLNIPVSFEIDGERESPYRDEKILP